MNMNEDLFSNMNVLIVEDSPTQAILLKEALERHHLKAHIAKDGYEALQELQKSLPDIVISDIEMPRLNGYDVCKHIKSDETLKTIPVILLTNLTNSMDVIKGIECGADSFLTKPFEINFLLSTIHDVLENRKLHKTSDQEKKTSFYFSGQRHFLQVNQVQIMDLLLSTYSNAVQKNNELEKAYRNLNLIHEELEKKNDELNDLNIQKNQFIGMAAHDLRNPLTVIKGYSDLLLTRLNDKVDADSLRILERIQSSSSFMLRLINDMLDISVIESGTVSLHKSDVKMADLIHESIILHQSGAEKKNVKLIFNCKNSGLIVHCDANKMSQILNNLISNAIKFSNENGIVEVSLESNDNDILLSVKDSGVGISPEMKEQLFQPFAKSHAQGTHGEKGTGLGLAIVQKIIEEHKGKIWFKSDSGKGTTFFVSIPNTK